MPEGSSLLPSIRELAISPDRPAAIRALAERLGTDALVIFVFDPEVAVWLAAPGFPQTFPEGRRWQSFISLCAAGSSRRGYLPWPNRSVETPAWVWKASASVAVLFLGRFPGEAEASELIESSPLLAAFYAGERLGTTAAMQLEQADKIAQEARTLALCLDDARRSAQQEVAARREAESRLARARDELAAAQTRIEATLSATEVATWTWDVISDRVMADANMARLFGISPADAAGGPIANYLAAVHSDDLPRVERVIADALRLGRYEIDYRLMHPPGSIRWVTARGKVECNPQGDPVRFSGVIIDITSRKQAEAELARAKLEVEQHNQSLEQAVAQRTAKLSETVAELEAFSYSIAHDMRSPLRAMQGFAEILLQEHAASLSPDAHGLLLRIARAADRMDQLIRDVLSYSRIIRDDSPMDPVELDPLVRGILETYPTFASDQADITVEGPLPPVEGNAAMLSQVLSNLIGNAVKFVAPGQRPKVLISATREGDRVKITVRDFGIGIAADQFEKIFGIFQRVELSYPGTGIGLAVVKKAVERMRGTVGVASELGRGSVFWFTLAAAEAGDIQPKFPGRAKVCSL